MTDQDIKAEEARRVALTTALVKLEGGSLTRDTARFMIDLAAKAWEDTQKLITNASEMLEPKDRALMSIVTAKTINAGVDQFLQFAAEMATDELAGRSKSKEDCDCTVCQLRRAAESGEDMNAHPMVEMLKAAGFEIVDGGDGYMVLEGKLPKDEETKH